jgi:hypothetical protein
VAKATGQPAYLLGEHTHALEHEIGRAQARLALYRELEGGRLAVLVL